MLVFSVRRRTALDETTPGPHFLPTFTGQTVHLFPYYHPLTCSTIRPSLHSPDMADKTATTDVTSSPSIDSYRALCKGCRAAQPLTVFLHQVDPSCYRLRLQCRRCIQKSTKYWRDHRADIKAARASRERDCERITCVCGISINARYRTQHCRSKRHASVVSILRQHNALSPNDSSASVISPPAPSSLRETRNLQEEFEEAMAALEREFPTQQEQRSSLPQWPDSSIPHTAAPPTSDGLVGEDP